MTMSMPQPLFHHIMQKFLPKIPSTIAKIIGVSTDREDSRELSCFCGSEAHISIHLGDVLELDLALRVPSWTGGREDAIRSEMMAANRS